MRLSFNNGNALVHAYSHDKSFVGRFALMLPPPPSLGPLPEETLLRQGPAQRMREPLGVLYSCSSWPAPPSTLRRGSGSRRCLPCGSRLAVLSHVEARAPGTIGYCCVGSYRRRAVGSILTERFPHSCVRCSASHLLQAQGRPPGGMIGLYLGEVYRYALRKKHAIRNTCKETRAKKQRNMIGHAH